MSNDEYPLIIKIQGVSWANELVSQWASEPCFSQSLVVSYDCLNTCFGPQTPAELVPKHLFLVGSSLTCVDLITIFVGLDPSNITRNIVLEWHWLNISDVISWLDAFH